MWRRAPPLDAVLDGEQEDERHSEENYVVQARFQQLQKIRDVLDPAREIGEDGDHQRCHQAANQRDQECDSRPERELRARYALQSELGQLRHAMELAARTAEPAAREQLLDAPSERLDGLCDERRIESQKLAGFGRVASRGGGRCDH